VDTIQLVLFFKETQLIMVIKGFTCHYYHYHYLQLTTYNLQLTI